MGHFKHKFCQTDVALHCLDDMRWNRSKNVSPNCTYPVSRIKCTDPTEQSEASNKTGVCTSETVFKSGMQLIGKTKYVEEWHQCCPILDESVSYFY